MKYRRPQEIDFQQMADLNNRNMISVLNEAEKADGFLSASFSVEQFKTMDDDLCVICCVDDDKVCGYVCASSIEVNKSIPLVAAMIDNFSQIAYQGKLLAEYHSFIYGPVCIDKDYRGKGILANIFKKMFEVLAEESPQLELLTVLISTENQRSINAHKKLGMETVGQFEFNQKNYLILVLPTTTMKFI